MGKMLAAKIVCALLVLLFGLNAFAQQTQRRANNLWAKIRRLTAEDHQKELSPYSRHSCYRMGFDPSGGGGHEGRGRGLHQQALEQ